MVTALLIPALAGFLLLFITNLSRFWLNRQSGYKLFFATACAGVFVLILARVLAIHLIGSESIPDWWYRYAPFEMSETFAISLLMSILLAGVINCFVDRNKAAWQVAGLNGDLIECLLEELLVRNALVELTMANGKVYVGFPRESGVTVTGESDIALVPLASGYRDEVDKTMVVTTRYDQTLDALVGHRNSQLRFDDFQVILPMREVKSARFFDPQAYMSLQNSNAS